MLDKPAAAIVILCLIGIPIWAMVRYRRRVRQEKFERFRRKEIERMTYDMLKREEKRHR